MALTRGKADRSDATPTTRKKEQSKRVRSESPDNTPDPVETKRSKVIEALDDAFPAAQDTPVSGNQGCGEDDPDSARVNDVDNARDVGMHGEDASIVVDEKDIVSGSPDHIFTEVVGVNPFSSLFQGTKTILPGALAVSLTKQDALEVEAISPINVLEIHRPTEANRILRCASHVDNTTIKSPKGGIINIALADPASFSVDPRSGYLFSKQTRSWALCSLLGRSTYYSNSDTRIRQICITPFKQGWYRFVAVLAQVYGHRTLFFQSFKEGLTFGTSRFSTNGLATPGKPGKSHVAPIEGSVLKSGKEIPVYDGRDKFQLGNYWDHPYMEDIADGATVMLLFSVKKGGLPKGAEGANIWDAKFAIYPNILAIILLADPAECFSNIRSQEGPEAFGVDSILGESENEDDETDNEVAEEPFL